MDYSKISLSKLCSADWFTFDKEWNKLYMKDWKIINIYK